MAVQQGRGEWGQPPHPSLQRNTFLLHRQREWRKDIETLEISTMAILVTGGAAGIGSHMAHALVDRGESVVVLDDLSTGHRHAVPSAATLVVGDIGDIALVRSTIKAHDIRDIVHFAARIVVVDSIAQPLDYYMNNTVRSRALFEAAVTSGVERLDFPPPPPSMARAATDLIPETADKRPITLIRPVEARDRTAWTLPRHTSLSHAVLRYFNVAGQIRRAAAASPAPRDPSHQGCGRSGCGPSSPRRSLRRGLRYA